MGGGLDARPFRLSPPGNRSMSVLVSLFGEKEENDPHLQAKAMSFLHRLADCPLLPPWGNTIPPTRCIVWQPL